MKKLINFISSPALTNILLIILLIMLVYGYNILTNFRGEIKVYDDGVVDNTTEIKFSIDSNYDDINERLSAMEESLDKIVMYHIMK